MGMETITVASSILAAMMKHVGVTEMYLFSHRFRSGLSKSKVLLGLAFSQDISRAVLSAHRTCPVGASASGFAFFARLHPRDVTHFIKTAVVEN